MVGFEEALGEHRPPRAGDIDVTFAPRRLPKPAEPKNEEATLPAAEHSAEEAAEHGGTSTGGATGAAGGGSSASGATGNGGAEQITQRDEPDDGEHTDSTEEQLAARAEAAAENAAAGGEAEQPVLEPAQEPVAEPESEEEPGPDPSPAKTPAPEKNLREQLAQFSGAQPVEYQKTGFSAGDVETVLVKRFPAPLVDRLRLSLAPSVGGTFAEQLSAPALITAFLIAKTGMELQVDPNTAVAVDVFRQTDPGLLSVERRLDEVLEKLAVESERSAKTLKGVREISDVTDGLENSVAYLVGDRVTRLSTTEVDETNVDVTQKKVLVVRDRIRERTKEQRKREQDREGRDIHRAGGTSGDRKRS